MSAFTQNSIKSASYPATMGKYHYQGDFSEGTPLAGNRQFWDMGETVAGRGVQTKDDCGAAIGFYECSNDQCPTYLATGSRQIEAWTNNCSKAQCPVCFKHWIKRRTKVSSERLLQVDRMLPMPCKHIVLSPPRDWDGKGLSKILKLLGVRGGAVVRHPWRFRDKQTGLMIAWKDCDINPISELAIPSVAVRSLHYHILGFGFLVSSDKFYESTGWVYKNRGKRSGNSIPRTMAYLLSHAGVHGRKQTVRWFGIIANNKLSVTVKMALEAKCCPACGSDMDKYQYYFNEPVKVENRRLTRYKYYRFKE
jgi:hypothetical protein